MRAELDRSKERLVSDLDDTAALYARGLSKRYGRGRGLVRAAGLDPAVTLRETVAVMGPAAAGSPRCGTCRAQLGERALARARRTAVGFVVQAFQRMEELAAVDNVEMAAVLAGRSPRTARRRAAEVAVPAIVLVVAVLTNVPARLGACRPVAEILQSESA